MQTERKSELSALPIYLEPIPVNRDICGRKFRRRSNNGFFIGDPASGNYLSILVLKAVPEEGLIAISIKEVRDQQIESQNSYQLSPDQTYKLRGAHYYLRGDIKETRDRKVVEFTIETPRNIPVVKAEKYRENRKKLEKKRQAELATD